MKLLKTDKKTELIEFTIAADKDVWQKELSATTKELAKRVSIPGFRKGKVPFKLAEKQVKTDAYNATLNKVLPKMIDELEKENATANLPELIDQPYPQISLIDDTQLEVIVKYDIMPTITIGDFSHLNLNLSTYHTVSEEEVDAEIKRLLERSTKLEATTKKTLENNDVAVIDFVGSIDGKEFIGGSAKNFNLTIGSKSFIDNFEDQLIGMNVGEEKVIHVKFPEDYHSKQMAGKPADFKVKLNEIKLNSKYKLDDEFAQSLNLTNVSTVSELKDFILNNFKERNLVNIKHIVKNELTKKIAEITEISFIPELTYNDEKHRIRQIIEKQVKDQKTTIEKSLKENNITDKDLEKSIEQDALNALKYVFAIDKIAHDNSIEFTDKDYIEYIHKIAQMYNVGYEVVAKQFDRNKELICEEMLNERVLEFIIQQNIDNNTEAKPKESKPKTGTTKKTTTKAATSKTKK